MKKHKSLISRAVSATEARTIVYIHGIGNKPQASILKCQWDRALMGFDLGERSRLAYWVSREFYPEPSREECRDGDLSPKTDRDRDGMHVKARLEQDNLGDLVDALAVNQPSRSLTTLPADRFEY